MRLVLVTLRMGGRGMGACAGVDVEFRCEFLGDGVNVIYDMTGVAGDW